MNKILKLIRKILGCEKTVSPIVDSVSYSANEHSFCGNSLSDSNLLVVHSENQNCGLFEKYLANEHTSFAFIKLSNDLCLNDFADAGRKLLGPFTHIVNIVKVDECNGLLHQNSGFNGLDATGVLFRLLQKETDYLVKNLQYSTISTILILNPSVDAAVMSKSLELSIEGLAPLLANHDIICNGAVADQSVPEARIYETALFLSGKYGQILTGEMLRLS